MVYICPLPQRGSLHGAEVISIKYNERQLAMEYVPKELRRSLKPFIPKFGKKALSHTGRLDWLG